MKKLILIIILAGCFNLTACSSPAPIQTNIDGVVVTVQEQEMENYLTRLRNLISDHVELVVSHDVVFPPNFDKNSIIREDRLPSGNSITYITLKNGSIVSFADSVNGDREDGNLEYWVIRAYDINNNVLYLTHNQSYGFYDFIGLSLNTGNQFEVYWGNTGGDDDWMYDYKFSPDMKYLLRAGDLYPNEYGWSVVDLSNGQEFKKLYERYIEFISGPWWKREGEFRIAYSRIPYVYGLEYKDDYRFFNQINRNEPVRWSMFSTYDLITKEQIFNIKGDMLSEKVIGTKKIERN